MRTSYSEDGTSMMLSPEIRDELSRFTRPGLDRVTGGFLRALGYRAAFEIRSSDRPLTGGASGLVSRNTR